MKRTRKLDLAIQFLAEEKNRLIKEIQSDQGRSKDNIELKEQIIDAIQCLELCNRNNIYPDQVKIINIPEGGSEAHFTQFNIVDEKGIEQIEDWAIKKNEQGPIKLNCFDLIIKK